MALISKPEILRVLKAYNPWWESGEVPPSLLKRLRRTPFFEILKLVNNKELKRAVVLPGPRRVGKTTILFQLADYAIKNKKLNPRSVIYLTLEHPVIKLMSIDYVLDLYEEEIGKGENEEKVVLLDELQYVDEPTTWLKMMVDRHPSWKIIATGSASIAFKNKDLESGVGRWIEVPVPTLSLFEYVLLREYEKKEIVAPKFGSGQPLKPTSLAALPEEKRKHILQQLEPVKKYFNDFLLKGGFPESALLDDVILAQRLLREDVVDKVLKRDMAAFYKIRKLPELERLFVYLCMHSGSIVNEVVISRELKITRATLDSLLESLEGAHLIRRIVGIDITGKKVLKGKTKWYVVDSSMRNAVLLKGEEVFKDPVDMGLMVEAATINQVYSFIHRLPARLGHWRGKKDKEVDLVVGGGKYTPIAIEVKYRDNFELDPNEGIVQYLGEKGEAVGILVNKEAKDIQTTLFNASNKIVSIMQVPAYAFLYMLGHYEYQCNKLDGAEMDLTAI